LEALIAYFYLFESIVVDYTMKLTTLPPQANHVQ